MKAPTDVYFCWPYAILPYDSTMIYITNPLCWRVVSNVLLDCIIINTAKVTIPSVKLLVKE